MVNKKKEASGSPVQVNIKLCKYKMHVKRMNIFLIKQILITTMDMLFKIWKNQVKGVSGSSTPTHGGGGG